MNSILYAISRGMQSKVKSTFKKYDYAFYSRDQVINLFWQWEEKNNEKLKL